MDMGVIFKGECIVVKLFTKPYGIASTVQQK